VRIKKRKIPTILDIGNLAEVIQGTNGALAYWGLQETEGTVAFAWNRANGTTGWLANNAVLASETTIVFQGTRSLKLTRAGGNAVAYQTLGSASGKSWLIEVWGYNPTAGGSANIQIRAGSVPGTDDVGNSTSVLKDQWVKLSLIIEPGIATVYIGFGLSGAAVEYVYYDNATVREANPLDSVITSATVGQPGQGNIPYVYNFDGINDFVDIYSTELNTILDTSKGSLIIVARLSAVAWADGVFRRAISLQADVNNQLIIQKRAGANEFSVTYLAGGTNKTITWTGETSTDLNMWTMTWDTTADEVNGYRNSVLESTLNGLGVWAGNLGATTTNIGTTDQASNFFLGDLTYAILADEALTQSEISAIYQALGI
jgi:hypothetical protein